MLSIIEPIGYLAVLLIAIKFYSFLWYLFRCYFLTRIGFACNLKKFGEWAVVTGATDGIGKEYARQLAAKGINIVLISRTKAKLKEVALQIEEDFHVKTKIIPFDFTNSSGYELIESELANLEIGILINNVGTGDRNNESFHDYTMNSVCDVLRCNIFSDVHMSNIVLKGMATRNQGIVVHLSSGVVFLDAPHLNIYSPTKCFMNKFVKSLQLEYAGQIHHQLVTPMYVATNLSRQKTSFLIPSAKEYVESALLTVGIGEVTCGYFRHELLRIVLMFCPQFIVTNVFRRVSRKKK